MRSEWDGWTWVGRFGLDALFRAGFRMRFEGLEHIPEDGGALLTYNHVSVLDPMMVAIGAGKRGRPVRFLVLAQDFDRTFVGWAVRATHQVPLKRGLGDWAAIEQVAAVLREGRLAGMAPEGTVGHGEGMQAGRRGAARIAMAAGVPVLPVGVWGTNERWGKQGLSYELRRPAAVAVFGEPLVAEGDPKSIPDTKAMTERIMAGVEEVAERARAEAALVSGHRGSVG